MGLKVIEQCLADIDVDRLVESTEAVMRSAVTEAETTYEGKSEEELDKLFPATAELEGKLGTMLMTAFRDLDYDQEEMNAVCGGFALGIVAMRLTTDRTDLFVSPDAPSVPPSS